MPTLVSIHDRRRTGARQPVIVSRGVCLEVIGAAMQNVVVARHFRQAHRWRLTTASLARHMLAIALLAATGLALILIKAVPPTIDCLLTVAAIGAAAGHGAAATGHRRSHPVRQTAANDNPRRPVLPPHLLRC